MEKQILMANEVAELLRIDKQRVYELARNKKIPVIKVGIRQYRFSSEAIKKWLETGGSAGLEGGDDNANAPTVNRDAN